jgi:hypothetical protein
MLESNRLRISGLSSGWPSEVSSEDVGSRHLPPTLGTFSRLPYGQGSGGKFHHSVESAHVPVLQLNNVRCAGCTDRSCQFHTSVLNSWYPCAALAQCD